MPDQASPPVEQPRPPLSIRVAHALGWLNLIYVGFLATPATFYILERYGYPVPAALTSAAALVFFIVGSAAVAVELAVLATYTRLPRSIPLALLLLLDGPVLAVLAAPHDHNLFAFAVRGFLIDGVAVWFSIGVLALRTPVLDGRSRLVPATLAFGMLAGVLLVFWPYLHHELDHAPMAIGALVLGAVSATSLHYGVLAADDVVRDSKAPGVLPYLIGLTLAWVVAMCAGSALHDLHT